MPTAPFALTTLAAAFADPAAPLPPHDVLFNVIGDGDLCRADLLAAETLAAASSAPVINPPSRVLPTARMANARRLAALPGVITPQIALIPRGAGEADADAIGREGVTFPLLLRSPGFHTGRHFVQVDRPADLPAAAGGLPGPELMAMQYLDARGADGYSRKYRVMMIAGQLYPVHLAISADWKVHYATAAMSGQSAFQAEEARFLDHMPEVLGDRAMAGLQAIQDSLGLDYGGVDFAVDTSGRLLLFEANAVMKILPPGPIRSGTTAVRRSRRRWGRRGTCCGPRPRLPGRGEAANIGWQPSRSRLLIRWKLRETDP